MISDVSETISGISEMISESEKASKTATFCKKR
jgi:hypothetical protein